MKNFFYLLVFISLFSSCSDDLEIDYPSTYVADSVEIISTTAFRSPTDSNDSYEEISLEEAGMPNTSGMTGGGNMLTIINNSMISFDDGFGQEDIEYSTSGDELIFRSNVSSYRMIVSDDGTSIRSRRVGGGQFDDLNPFPTTSATCEDEGCDDVNPGGYLFIWSSDEIGYLIEYDVVYSLQ